jgi:hypothetical protein
MYWFEDKMILGQGLLKSADSILRPEGNIDAGGSDRWLANSIHENVACTSARIRDF